MAKQGIQPKHLFMGGLAILGVYVANEMYKQYKLDQAKKAAIAGGLPSGVFTQVAPGVPPTPSPSIVLPPSAGLPSCAELFPHNGDATHDFQVDLIRASQRIIGQCT